MMDVEEDVGRERELGLVEKITKFGKKVLGREEYEPVRGQDDEGLADRARRQRETPSSIYAHKTVEVNSCTVTSEFLLICRTQYETSRPTLLKVCPPQLSQAW
jgi:hypothetical protein